MGVIDRHKAEPLTLNPADNCLYWNGLCVQSASAYSHERDADRITAICLYLQGQGITPDVGSIHVFRKSIDFALYTATSRKLLFLYSFEDAPMQPRSVSFYLEHVNSGHVIKDVQNLKNQVEHYKQLVNKGSERYIDCLICTREAFEAAHASIGLNALGFIVTDEDALDSVKAATLNEIQGELNRLISPQQLPSRQSIEDKLIGPYLYQIIVQRTLKRVTASSAAILSRGDGNG